MFIYILVSKVSTKVLHDFFEQILYAYDESRALTLRVLFIGLVLQLELAGLEVTLVQNCVSPRCVPFFHCQNEFALIT